MTTPPTLDPGGERRGLASNAALRAGLCVSLTVLFTVVQIRRSQGAGRLSALPQYDDVTYLLQGLARAGVLREEGLLGFVRDLVGTPLWSPWGSLAATFGFVVTGLSEWSPYAVNGLLVLALLLLIDRLTRGASILIKLACWMLALALPLSAHAVADFRPDFATGFATATGILCILRITATRGGRRAAVLAGVVSAVALLAKPTVFAASVVYLGSAGLVMVAREVVRLRRSSDGSATPRHLLANICLTAGVTLLLIAPQYALQHKAYWYYFKINTFGSRASLWDRGLSGLDNIAYFLTGPAGQLMFGWMLLPLALVAVGGTVHVFRRGARSLGWRLVQVWLVALVCIALPATNATKNPYFGIVFGTLLLCIGVVGLRVMLGDLSAQRRRHGPIAGGLVVAVLLVPASLNRPSMTPGAAFNATFLPGFDPARSNQAAMELADALAAAIERVGLGGDTAVHFTGSGYLNQHTMSYLLMRRGHARPATTDSAAFDDPVRLARGVALADVVVAFEPGFADEAGRSLMHDRFPGNRALDRSISFARSDAGLIEVARVASPAGPSAVVFVRTSKTSLRPKEFAGSGAG